MLKVLKRNISLKKKIKFISLLFFLLMVFFSPLVYSVDNTSNVPPLKDNGCVSSINQTDSSNRTYLTIYVSQMGNDINHGNSWNKPVKTIERALKLVSNNGTIILDDGVYYLMGVISKNVTIASDGGAAYTIISSEYIAPLTIDHGSKVHIKGISFVNRVSQTGSIVNYGRLIVTDCIFRNCTGVRGGAIYNGYSVGVKSWLFCKNCVFEKCSASMGGAVYNEGDAYLVNSDCKNNTANLGGAVFNLHNLKITSSYFKNNFAGRGGAIYNGIETTKTLIRHSILQDNKAEQGMVVFSNSLYNDPITFMDHDYVDPENKNNYAGPITISNPLNHSKKVIITINPVKVLYGFSFNIKGNIKSEIHPKLITRLKNVHLQLFIDNRYVGDVVSDNDGNFQVDINNLIDPGMHELKCVFGGNDRYNSCVTDTQVVVTDWRGIGFIPKTIKVPHPVPYQRTVKEITNATPDLSQIEEQIRFMNNLINELTIAIVVLLGLLGVTGVKILKNRKKNQRDDIK